VGVGHRLDRAEPGRVKPHRDWPYLQHDGVLAFAHRGGAGDWPENTMVAFEHAVATGYRYVETDVHLTADGVLVAFHDERLDRVTDRTGRISELPWSVVSSAEVGPPEGSTAAAGSIPLLEDILGAWPSLRVNIDPKHDASVGPLLAVLDRTAAWDRVGVGAFSDRRLARVRRQTNHRVCTGLGPADIARLRLASMGAPVGHFAAACAQVPTHARGRVLVDARFVHEAHRRDLQVHVWTVDDPVEMTRLLDLEVDGIMTDRPTELKAVLEQRGRWA
jgi:glycerophosphoryl diester phosphodiesterase